MFFKASVQLSHFSRTVSNQETKKLIICLLSFLIIAGSLMLRIRRTSLTNMSVAGNESHLNYGMFPPGGKCRRGLDKEFEGLKCKQETLSAFETEKQNISFLERNKFFFGQRKSGTR